MGIEDLKAKKVVEEPTVPQSNTEKRAELAEMREKLERLEKTTGRSGAVPMTPKAKLLDMSDVEDKHPGKHIRLVNTAVPEKVQQRQMEGYERVPLAEGGRQVGNLAPFALPKEKYQERVAEITRKNKERLESHKTEVERIAEGVARELRDKHGISVNAGRILINE